MNELDHPWPSEKSPTHLEWKFPRSFSAGTPTQDNGLPEVPSLKRKGKL
jgi:hypothetical protein